jgi:glycerol-3-phosphate dehydrogenase (NAD(P)+)
MIGVVGTGSFGTAMAMAALRSGPVVLWGREARKVALLADQRRHPDLGEIALPAELTITADPARLGGCAMLLWAVPAQHSRAQARGLAGVIPAGTPMISLAKGIEEGTHLRVTEVLAQELPGRPLACLSGPAIAEEVAAGLPCALVAAGAEDVLPRLVARLHQQRLRVYTSPDLPGVELCGALKNVVAIAAGACDGLGLGDNAKAVVIARGLAEMRRLGRALGCQDATFAGLAGIGDLMTTCYSSRGRNRSLGMRIARGEKPREVLATTHTIAEGAWTSRAAVDLAATLGVELPIASQVALSIWDATPVATGIQALLARSPKEENA